MLKRLFRSSRLVALPRSSAELAQALRAAAQYADGDAARLEYTTAADALDRAVVHGRKADAPTRDAFAYALGRAELDLKEQMTELIEISKDTHLMMQQVQSEGQQQGAAVVALRADFQTFGELMSGRMLSLEEQVGAFGTRMDSSESDRKSLHDQGDRMEHKLSDIEEQMRRLLGHVPAIDLARQAELIAMIERHEQLLSASEKSLSEDGG